MAVVGGLGRREVTEGGRDGGATTGRSRRPGLLSTHSEPGGGSGGVPGSVSSNLKKSSMKTSLLKINNAICFTERLKWGLSFQ
ncbi:hypothetical protein MC885_013540, partial [Smutsia gigantea]